MNIAQTAASKKVRQGVSEDERVRMDLGGKLLSGWVQPRSQRVLMHASQILEAHTLICNIGMQSPV